MLPSLLARADQVIERDGRSSSPRHGAAG